MTPQDIVLAIPIEVGKAGHLPVQVGHGDHRLLGGAVGGEPNGIGPGGGVPPHHITLAIAIEVEVFVHTGHNRCLGPGVGLGLDAPGGVGHGEYVLHGGAVGAVPDDIGPRA